MILKNLISQTFGSSFCFVGSVLVKKKKKKFDYVEIKIFDSP